MVIMEPSNTLVVEPFVFRLTNICRMMNSNQEYVMY